MRFLLDENQSPSIGQLLTVAEHDVVHVRDVGRAGAPDEDLFVYAAEDNRVIVSGDTDFGELLARINAAGPSLILAPTGRTTRSSDRVIAVGHPRRSHRGVNEGAIVVLDEDRIRIRSLPLNPD